MDRNIFQWMKRLPVVIKFVTALIDFNSWKVSLCLQPLVKCLYCWFCLFWFWFWFLVFFRAMSAVCGSSQARGQIGAVAADLTPQLTATPDP